MTISKITLYLVLILSLSFSSIAQVKISATSKTIEASDGFQLVSYKLFSGKKFKILENPKAIFFYIQGSDYTTVTNKLPFMASAIILGSRAIMMEKRGCYYDHIDTAVCYQFADKETRITDHLKVIEAYIKNVPLNIPLIVVGGSEGGDIASVLAERCKRITQLILIGTGGGWSQSTELKYFVTKYPGYLGCKSIVELENTFSVINNSNNDTLIWAGNPYRRWKTFLNDSNLIHLSNVSIPILLLHGDADINVPVESARNLASTFNQLRKTNLTYIEYHNINHLLVDVNDNKSRYPYLEIDIIKWLCKQGVVSENESEQFSKRVKKAHRDIFK